MIIVALYSPAFYSQLEACRRDYSLSYREWLSPDECFIGTEKLSLEKLVNLELNENTLRCFKDFLESSKDYRKLDDPFIQN